MFSQGSEPDTHASHGLGSARGSAARSQERGAGGRAVLSGVPALRGGSSFSQVAGPRPHISETGNGARKSVASLRETTRRPLGPGWRAAR